MQEEDISNITRKYKKYKKINTDDNTDDNTDNKIDDNTDDIIKYNKIIINNNVFEEYYLIIDCYNHKVKYYPFLEENTPIICVYDYVSYLIKIDDDNFWLSYYGKPIINNNNILDDYKLSPGSIIQVNIKQKGGIFGGGGIAGKVVDIVADKIVGPIVKPVKSIANVLKMLLKFFIALGKIGIWIIQFALWLIMDFLNPYNLLTDLIGGVQRITRLIFVVIMDVLFGIIKFVFNKIFGSVFEGGLMGWDNATYQKDNRKSGKNSNKDKFKDTKNDLVNMKCHGNGQKCYRTPDGQVPFSVIISTILLPPMGVFMEFGITAWINIIICGMLTLLFYFPGLIYALILIYC